MKKMIQAFSIATIMTGFLAACSTAVDPSEAYKDESPQQIYATGKSALQNKNYAEAIKRFEALDVQYPYGTETENAQFYLIYSYYMKEEFALAVSAADHFIRLHPASPHVDYAYYMRGVSNYYQNLGLFERLFATDLAKRDLTQIQKSYRDFDELVTRFPNSRYAPAAHQFLIYLRNVMANHELGVARYYYDRKAYLAAANRASELVAHYQGAPAVVDGLKIMVNAYNKLGMLRNEQEALTVLKYNYPNANADLDV